MRTRKIKKVRLDKIDDCSECELCVTRSLVFKHQVRYKNDGQPADIVIFSLAPEPVDDATRRLHHSYENIITDIGNGVRDLCELRGVKPIRITYSTLVGCYLPNNRELQKNHVVACSHRRLWLKKKLRPTSIGLAFPNVKENEPFTQQVKEEFPQHNLFHITSLNDIHYSGIRRSQVILKVASQIFNAGRYL